MRMTQPQRGECPAGQKRPNQAVTTLDITSSSTWGPEVNKLVTSELELSEGNGQIKLAVLSSSDTLGRLDDGAVDILPEGFDTSTGNKVVVEHEMVAAIDVLLDVDDCVVLQGFYLKIVRCLQYCNGCFTIFNLGSNVLCYVLENDLPCFFRYKFCIEFYSCTSFGISLLL